MSDTKKIYVSVKKKNGFTVVEIMIGVFIFALLFLGFNEFMYHSRRQTENLFQKGDNLRETRLALQHFETDVRNSAEVTEFEDCDEFTTMTLKHVKEIKKTDPSSEDPMVYDYITYTFYKKKTTGGGTMINPLSLVRMQSDQKPQDKALATGKPLLQSFSDNMTNNTIGVLKEYDFAVDGVGTVKKETGFFAIDKNYYFNQMWDDTLALEKKDEMIKKASYKGKYGGSEVGYKEIKDSVAVWLQFIIGDNNKNVYYFNQIVYMRSKI